MQIHTEYFSPTISCSCVTLWRTRAPSVSIMSSNAWFCTPLNGEERLVPREWRCSRCKSQRPASLWPYCFHDIEVFLCSKRLETSVSRRSSLLDVSFFSPPTFPPSSHVTPEGQLTWTLTKLSISQRTCFTFKRPLTSCFLSSCCIEFLSVSSPLSHSPVVTISSTTYILK